MRIQSTNHRDEVVGELADAQHGAVSRGQPLAAGLCRDTIGRSVRAGRLRTLFQDRGRDRQLLAAGWRPARFTYEEVAFDPAATARELRSLLPNLARPRSRK